MNLNVLATLYRKEMLDFLRDRRTVISMFIAPVVFMPLSMIGTISYLSHQRDTARVKRYKVAIQSGSAVEGLSAALQKAGFEVKPASDPRQEAESKNVDFGIDATLPAVKVYADLSEITTQIANARITDALDGLRKAKIRSDLEALHVPVSVLSPFRVDSVNLAKPRKMTGSILGSVLGFILMIFIFNGAMYAAVDMTAGEKERRTIEMLLSSAAGRMEIVVAKVFAAVTTSFCSAFLTLFSFASGFVYLHRMDAQAGKFLDFPIDPATVALIAIAILPMCILAAGGAIALASPARSVREATSYLTLVLFVPMMLGGTTFLPGMENHALLDLIPVGNFMRLIRQVMLGDWSWAHFGLTMLANMAYATGAALLALRKFNDETILFRV